MLNVLEVSKVFWIHYTVRNSFRYQGHNYLFFSYERALVKLWLTNKKKTKTCLIMKCQSQENWWYLGQLVGSYGCEAVSETSVCLIILK